jgi:hypothetical protein
MTLSIAAAAALLSIAKGFSKPPQIYQGGCNSE